MLTAGKSCDALERTELIKPSEIADSILSLIQQLVRIPSRAGTDAYDPVLEAIRRWLLDHDIECEFLTDSGGVASACAAPWPGPPRDRIIC